MKYHNNLATWPEFLLLDLSPKKVVCVSLGRLGDLGSCTRRLPFFLGIISSGGSA